MSILAQAIQRWEAESGAMRRLAGLPYDLDTYVAGFILGYRGAPVELPPGLDSARVGFRSGETERRIDDREDAVKTESERRAPVQGERDRPAGTVAWSEHVEAWRAYDAKYRSGQSAERIAERAGFSYRELVMFLGREPETWRAR